MAIRAPQMTLVDALPIEGKRVLVRVDFNVPLEDGRVADDSRIQAAMKTIRHIIERGGRLILVSHLGRPKGQVNEAFSLAPAGERLAELLDQEILLSDLPVGDAATRLSRELRDGEVLLLENIRFHPGETRNDDALARELGAMADFYVNDAFGTAHRAHASTAGIARHVRDKAAGYLIAREVKSLSRLLNAPKSGFLAILGGAKVSDKIAVMEQLMDRVEVLLVGGAMAYTFLAAQGHAVGSSRVESDRIDTALRILALAKERGVEIVLPIDHGCAESFSPDVDRVDVDAVAIPEGLMGLDIGPRTQALYAEKVAAARTIFWNGPMGVFEWPVYAAGTRSVADAVAESSAWSVVGGGDSVRAVTESGRADEINHISTGGGASLEFLEGKELPGLKALGVRSSS